jgi:hypothetical protein
MTTAGCFQPAVESMKHVATALRTPLIRRGVSPSIGSERGSVAAHRALFAGDFISPAVGDAFKPLYVRAVPRASSASRREETPSFRSRLFTCERTVCSEMNRRVAIWSVLR